MKLIMKVTPSWIEMTVEEGNAKITYDIWRDELADMKTQLENAIQDIEFMIEKLGIQGGNL